MYYPSKNLNILRLSILEGEERKNLKMKSRHKSIIWSYFKGL